MTTPHLTTPHLAAGAAPTPGLRRWLLPSAIVVGLAMIGVGLATSTAYWTGAFAHELRTQRHGGEIVATTIAGARWWRAALVAGGVLIPAMIAVLDRRIGAAPSPSADTRGIAGDPARSRRGLTAAGLAVLALLALALRLPRLTESLWYDEIADFLAFGAFGPGATMGNYFTPSNHVLSGILCWASVTLAGGANEAVLRLPALFASLATVPACWWLAREATVESGRPRAAALLPWIVALLAAVAPVLLLSVEARGYAIMILSSALATALLLRGTRRGEGAGTGDVQLRIWILYAIVVSLGTWAHLVTACVAVGHAALLAADLRVAVRRRAAFAGLLAVALAATLTLILYSPLLPDLLSIRGQFKASDGDEPTLLGPEGLHSLLQMGGAWSWWAALPGIAMATLGAIATTGDAALRRAVVASLLGAVAAVVLAWAGDSWLYARFLLFAMPAALLLIAAGVNDHGRGTRRRAERSSSSDVASGARRGSPAAGGRVVDGGPRAATAEAAAAGSDRRGGQCEAPGRPRRDDRSRRQRARLVRLASRRRGPAQRTAGARDLRGARSAAAELGDRALRTLGAAGAIRRARRARLLAVSPPARLGGLGQRRRGDLSSQHGALSMSFGLSRGREQDVAGWGIDQSELPPYEAGSTAAGAPRFDPRTWFGRPELPFELEIGSGKGTFLLQEAAARPEANFLGIEWAKEFWRYAADRLRRHAVPNARMLRADATEFVRFRVPDGIVEVIHLYFSDPWPKSRHHKRRVVQDASLREFHRVLAPGGELRIVTDHDELWLWCEEHAAKASELFARRQFDRPASAAEHEVVGTNFERKYRREGRPFHAMTLVRR